MISGLSFMLTSIILLMLSQRGIVTIFDDGKDVIPLKAFLDWRPQGGYDNATIILVQVRKEILSGNRIIGCGIEEKTATMFEVYLLNTYKDYIHRFYQSLTHDEAVVLCYDLKLSHNKSRPYVIYRNTYDYPIHVKTKSDLIINLGVERINSMNPKVLLCATQVMGTEWLNEEWIQYQKSAGIDFIHLYTIQPVESMVSNHRVHVDQWLSMLGEGEVYLHSQSLQTMDCLYRYHGLFDYVLVYGTSDYFVPMMADKFDIKDYIKVLFNHKHTGSVLLRRVIYNIDDCKFKDQIHNMNTHTNISSILNHQEFKELDIVTKGIHKISAVREITSQKAASLMPGYVTERVSPEVAYVVHIRNRKSLQCV